jgi:enterochelin esterase-like enzyme
MDEDPNQAQPNPDPTLGRTWPRRRAGQLLALGALGSAMPWSARAAVAEGRLLDLPVRAPTGRLRARQVQVWLPPGYRDDGPAHAVLYMHDGQNLFEPERSYSGVPWAVDRALVALGSQVVPTLVVGVANTVDRWNEYLPAEPMRQVVPSVLRGLGGSFDSGAGLLADDYLHHLVHDIKPAVDARFRTRPEARFTGVMGSSMGGLVSLYALVRHPRVFGRAAGLSTHWPLGSLEPREGLQSTVTSVSRVFRSWLQEALPPPTGRRLYLDHGDQDLDAAYPAHQAIVDRILATRGWRQGEHLRSRAYPGTGHGEAAWQARLHEPLRFLFGRDR